MELSSLSFGSFCRRLLVATALLLLPAGGVLADPIIDNLPAETKYEPPCERGDMFIQNTCILRSMAETLRATATIRTHERQTVRDETRRTQIKTIRSSSLHPTGVRAARSNGFELLDPNSRQFKSPETTHQINLRQLWIKENRMGPAKARVDTTPEAQRTPRSRGHAIKALRVPQM